jgi:4'-phosphopantetheinyl transferase
MTLIYHTFFDTSLPEAAFQKKLDMLPSAQRDKILKFVRWQDAHAALFGKLLLMRGLREAGFHSTLDELKFTPYGKPYLDEGKVRFNISHSGNGVVCVLSTDTDSIGIDMEQVKDIDINDFQNLWSDNEWREICGGGLDVFYQYWTRKEAIIKAEGMGLSIPLKEIEVTPERGSYKDKTYFLKEIAMKPGFVIHVASLNELDSIKLITAPDMLL